MGDPLWTIDATLKAKGFSLVRPPSTYRGPISVHGNKAYVELEVLDLSFAALPKIRLVDAEALPIDAVAHINSDDTICYVGEGGLPLDLYNPGGSILRVLGEAESAMERSFGGNAAREFEGELPSYWNGSSVLVALRPKPENLVEHAELLDFETNKRTQRVVVNAGQWKHINPKYRRPITVLHFASPLRHSAMFKAETLAGIIEWLKTQVTDNPERIRRAIIASTASQRPILIVAPNAMIGWQPILPANLKMLQKSVRPNFFSEQVERSLNKIGLLRMTGTQFSLPYVVKRNLVDEPSLIGKRISLVGAGTIGGNLARLLVQSGAGCGECLTIYDTDVLRPGNLGRHVLGFSYLDQPKAHALADFLGNFHPDIQVKAAYRDALQDWDSLERADLIVDATGDYNVAVALNHRYMRSTRAGSQLAVLHAWVFGNGVAAQTFLNLRDGLACYRCLKPTFDGPWRYPPVKDVKAHVVLAPAVCGEAGYIPFAADAPVAAASLALRAVLDWLANRPGHRLRTITLNYDDGKDVRWCSPTQIDECPACGRR